MPLPSTATREFRAFYRDHYGFVWASVRRFGVPAALVDDATQDAFVVAYRRRAELSGAARPWLYGIARGVASNYRRSARRVERKRRAIAHATRPASATTREPQVLLHDLDRFLGELPDRDRELFVLSEVEGLTGPELAEALGCNKSTAYGRVRVLRQRFAQQADGDELLQRQREDRPRATARGWALLLPSLRGTEPGWLGLGTAGTSVIAAGLGGAVAAVVMGVVVLARAPDRRDPPPRAVTVAEAGHGSRAHGERGGADEHRERDEGGASIGEPSEAESIEATGSASPEPGPMGATRPAPRSSSGSSVLASAAEPADADHGDDLAEQNALLRAATRALAEGDPARALAATHDHARRFPASSLADLRTALRVEALCAEGKGAQARGEARAWAAAHPDSPTRQRILEACSARSAPAGQERG